MEEIFPNEMMCGDIRIKSNNTMEEMANLVKGMLGDKTIKSYLETLKENKQAGVSMFQ